MFVQSIPVIPVSQLMVSTHTRLCTFSPSTNKMQELRRKMHIARHQTQHMLFWRKGHVLCLAVCYVHCHAHCATIIVFSKTFLNRNFIACLQSMLTVGSFDVDVTTHSRTRWCILVLSSSEASFPINAGRWSCCACVALSLYDVGARLGSARLLGRPAAPALAAAVGRASLDGRVAAQQRNPKSPKWALGWRSKQGKKQAAPFLRWSHPLGGTYGPDRWNTPNSPCHLSSHCLLKPTFVDLFCCQVSLLEMFTVHSY